MSIRRYAIIVFVLVGLVSLSGATAASSRETLQVGVFVPTGDMQAVSDFEARVGRRQDIVMFFQAWADRSGYLPFEAGRTQAIINRGSIPMVTWEPWQWDGNGANQPDYSLANISGGRHDAYIRAFARSVKQVNGTVYMRIMHEMNGDWYAWSGTVNGNRPEQFVPAWRHIVDIFRQEGAANVRWVWAPNNSGLPNWDTASFSWYYPGDDYVDFAGVDGYNFGATASWSGWTSFAGVFDAAYRELTRLTSKPIIIAETASAESGGNKAAWITDAFNKLNTVYPQVSALIWFNENKETDWRVESSEASLNAYRAALAGLGQPTTNPTPAPAPEPAPEPEPSPAPEPALPDTLAPIGSVTINGGAYRTAGRWVRLNIWASDDGGGVAYMRFSNDGVFDDSAGAEKWRPFADAADWTLSSGRGTKTVYAQFMDGAGNVSATAVDTIRLRSRWW